MKNTIIKYGIILSMLFLVNNYMQIIPIIDEIIDNSTSGWIANFLLLIVTYLGINEYIKKSFDEKSYTYTNAVITGVGTNLIGALIFSIISTFVLVLNEIEISIAETILLRTFKYTFIGLIVSCIIPLTFKSAIREK